MAGFFRFGTLALLALAGCAKEPPPPPAVSVAVAPDRPLDGARGAAAMRTAALIEAALAQVEPRDLRRCLADFETGAPGRFRPPAHATWLIVASALPVEGDFFRRRHQVAPEMNPVPGDGWQDRLVYRSLLRSTDDVAGSVACLSCEFDYEGAALVYRRAYALDACRRAIPPEQDLATVVPLD